MFNILTLDSKGTFSYDHLIKLINGEFSCIVIDGFYSSNNCVTLTNQLVSEFKQFEMYKGIDARVFGNPLYWENKTIIDYWSKSKEWQFKLNRLFEANNISNPIENVLQLFRAIWGNEVTIPKEGNNEYFAGDIRIISSAGLHTDVVTRRIKSGILSKVKEQLSWNIYLTQPNEGFGALQVFNKKFEASDISHKKLNGFGYKKSVVQGCESVLIFPKMGSFVLFKSSNYHLVQKTPPSDLRMSITSFIGFLGENKPLIFWS
jgi:hypothetical protein